MITPENIFAPLSDASFRNSIGQGIELQGNRETDGCGSRPLLELVSEALTDHDESERLREG
jgi:hypothetical protein